MLSPEPRIGHYIRQNEAGLADTEGELEDSIHRAILDLVNPFLLTYNTPVAYAFRANFLVYERNEQEHLHEKAFINIWGWLLGLGCTGFAFRFL